MSSTSLMIQKKIQKKPVIIYLVPPKVIHAEASEFMALVQRLTGKSSSPVTPEAKVQDFTPGHRRIPVRVKARPDITQFNNGIYPSSSYVSMDSIEGNWLVNGGHDQSRSFVSSDSFVDTFQ